MLLLFFLREPDVYMLPPSGLDYIELENFHTGSEETESKSSDLNTTEEPEDYEDEERPRKDDEKE